ncbi:MFS transporter [SAR202 cluster bacterium AD-804-J14_MRT_500m]|nr:MFS transporter [SAR202 cluster bacterium AD-804-J14_MRT_500m]
MRKPHLTRLFPVWVLSYSAVILGVGFLVNLGYGFVQFTHSLTVPSMREGLELSYTQAGLLMTIGSALRMLGAMVFGTLAARYGSRFIIGVGAIVTSVAMILFGFAPNYLVAIVAMVVMGFAASAAITPMMGLISSWFDSETRGLAAGLAAAGSAAPFLVSGLLVPRLVKNDPVDGWRDVWYILAVVVLVVGVLAIILLNDSPLKKNLTRSSVNHEKDGSPRWPLEVYRNRVVWWITGMAFCSGWGVGIFSAYFGAYLADEYSNGLDLAGNLMVVIGALSLLGSVVWGRASDKLGRPTSLTLAFCFLGVSYGLFWLIPSIGVLVIASIFAGLTIRANYTICAAAAGEYVPVRFASAAFGLFSVGAILGQSIAPSVAGAVADATGTLQWAFAMAALSALFGALGGFVLQRRPKLLTI